MGLWMCDSPGSKSKPTKGKKRFNDDANRDDLPRQKTESRFGGVRPPPPGRLRTVPWALQLRKSVINEEA